MLVVAVLPGGTVVHKEIIIHYAFDPSPQPSLNTYTEPACTKTRGSIRVCECSSSSSFLQQKARVRKQQLFYHNKPKPNNSSALEERGKSTKGGWQGENCCLFLLFHKSISYLRSTERSITVNLLLQEVKTHHRSLPPRSGALEIIQTFTNDCWYTCFKRNILGPFNLPQITFHIKLHGEKLFSSTTKAHAQ